jgi:hypothetical protein
MILGAEADEWRLDALRLARVAQLERGGLAS